MSVFVTWFVYFAYIYFLYIECSLYTDLDEKSVNILQNESLCQYFAAVASASSSSYLMLSVAHLISSDLLSSYLFSSALL